MLFFTVTIMNNCCNFLHPFYMQRSQTTADVTALLTSQRLTHRHHSTARHCVMSLLPCYGFNLCNYVLYCRCDVTDAGGGDGNDGDDNDGALQGFPFFINSLFSFSEFLEGVPIKFFFAYIEFPASPSLT